MIMIDMMHMIKYISEQDLHGRTVFHRSLDLKVPMYLEIQISD